MPRIARAAAWSLLAAVAIGCRACWLPDRNLERRVTRAEVEGTWRMTAATLTLLERDGFEHAESQTFTLTLRKDGTAAFASARTAADGAASYETLAGAWTLEHDAKGGSNVLKANVLQLELRAPNRPARSVDHWNFTEVDDALRLWQWHGDPDSWEFVEYAKD